MSNRNGNGIRHTEIQKETVQISVTHDQESGIGEFDTHMTSKVRGLEGIASSNLKIM